MNSTIRALHAKHGPIVRLGPNELSVNSAASLKTIYGGGFDKSDFYEKWFRNFNVPNLVSTREGAPHSQVKRMISHVYSNSHILNSPDMRKIACTVMLERLLPVLRKEIPEESTSQIDVFRLFKAVGMDFTSAHLFGLGNSTDFIRNLGEWDKWLHDYESTRYDSPEKRAFGKTEWWCLAMCDAAPKESKEKSSSLETEPVVYDRLSRSMQQQHPERSYYNRICVASEMMDHLIAGYETTAITLSYAMYELSRNASIQENLRTELLTLSPPITRSSTTLPSFSSLDALPMLDAVVRETMRVYPVAAAPLPRVTPADKPTVLEGYNILGGVTVGSSALTLHRNKEVFPDPDAWLPSRWRDAKGEHLAEMNRWFWPFGSGGRMCIGNHLAMLGKSILVKEWCSANRITTEMKLSLATVYTTYSSVIVNNDRVEPLDWFLSAPASGKVVLGLKRI